MKNLDIIAGKTIAKIEANKVDINNALNIIGIINDEKLEKLNMKSAMKVYRIFTILSKRYGISDDED